MMTHGSCSQYNGHAWSLIGRILDPLEEFHPVFDTRGIVFE